MKNILAISGSTKSASTSLAILKFIQKEYHEQFDLNIYNSIANLPHFNPELETDLPVSVQLVRNKNE